MKLNKVFYTIVLLVLFSGCSFNIIPPISSPQRVALDISEAGAFGALKEDLQPIYLSGVYVAEPARSIKIYKCDVDGEVVPSGVEWVGSFEALLESELERALRESFTKVNFVSKESGAFSRSELSVKVYSFCLDTESGLMGLSGSGFSLKMLVSLNSLGTSAQKSEIITVKLRESGEVSDLIKKGFDEAFNKLVLWLQAQ